jgi:hypothetical protein
MNKCFSSFAAVSGVCGIYLLFLGHFWFVHIFIGLFGLGEESRARAGSSGGANLHVNSNRAHTSTLRKKVDRT